VRGRGVRWGGVGATTAPCSSVSVRPSGKPSYALPTRGGKKERGTRPSFQGTEMPTGIAFGWVRFTSSIVDKLMRLRGQVPEANRTKMPESQGGWFMDGHSVLTRRMAGKYLGRADKGRLRSTVVWNLPSTSACRRPASADRRVGSQDRAMPETGTGRTRLYRWVRTTAVGGRPRIRAPGK